VVLPRDGDLSVRVALGPPADGARTVRVHTRADGPAGRWTEHATGTVATHADTPAVAVPARLGTPLDVADVYRRLLATGHAIAPESRVLLAAWRHGDELVADVAVDEHTPPDRYAVHPAFLAAAVQLLGAESAEPVDVGVVTGLVRRRTAGTTARIHLAPAGSSGVRVGVVDDTGESVLALASLTLRPVDTSSLHRGGELLALRWRPARTPVVDPVEYEVWPWAGGAGDSAVVHAVAHAREAAERCDTALRSWLAADPAATHPLVVRTGTGDDLATAAVAGSVRAMQAAHPGRFVLAAVADTPAAGDALPWAVASGAAECALRSDGMRLPVLERVTATDPTPLPPGVVVLAGDLAGHGAAVARRLVTTYGATSVLLVGVGAAALRTDLADLVDRGVEIRAVDRDPAAPGVLEHAVGTLAGPLAAVYHLATPGHPEVAWRLHLLTADAERAAFVLVATAVPAKDGAVLGAIARHRRSLGLPASALTAAPWETGVTPLPPAEAVAMTDPFGTEDAEVFPARLDYAVLRAGADEVPAPLRQLAGQPAPDLEPSGDEFVTRLRGLDDADRRRAVLELVREEVAAVLGHDSAGSVEADRALSELGFDSFAAVELRRRLGGATGLSLPATLVFDHPTARATAEYLSRELRPAGPAEAETMLGEVDRLAGVLSDWLPEEGDHVTVTLRLEALLRTWRDRVVPAEAGVAADDVGQVTDEELFDILDGELGA